jgi:hypothetical protein
MKVEFLNSPLANKDARRALQTSSVLFLTNLPNGTYAIGDRGQNVFVVIDDLPTRSELKTISDLLQSARMASETRFYGEPDTRTQARDLRDGNKPQADHSFRRNRPQAIEIEL